MEKRKFNCPAEMTISLIGGKWKAILLYNMRKGSKRFGELKRLSPGITPTTLTKELKELEKSGIVQRFAISKDRLAGVEYSLTPKGESLKPVLYAMIRWGIANQKDYVIGDFGMAVFQK
ncbi:winged helix-turn-helix transcriptional regulator [Bdellovibrio bacteriovorus]|uniref:winged helix-turn-helix transcriptional regulator n=1 Tax=Bdellovibrio bacteriovorus TaxID=959 RepID=UPI0009C11BC9|nr:helix-turn-helix domain-containing protein [Bdellovibrio bacteriovorus]